MDISQEPKESHDSAQATPDHGHDMDGNRVLNVEMASALEASRKNSKPSRTTSMHGDSKNVGDLDEATLGSPVDMEDKDTVPNDTNGDEIQVDEQGSLGTPKDVALTKSNERGVSGVDRAAVSSASSQVNSEVPENSGKCKEVRGGSGVNFQDDARTHQADTDIVMADVAQAPDADADEAMQAPSSKSRKRGVQSRRKGRPAKATKKSQVTPKSVKIAITDAAPEQTDLPSTGQADNQGSAGDATAESAPSTNEPRRSGRRATRNSRTHAEEDSDAEFDPTLPASSEASMPSDPKSKLVKADIMSILRDPRAWTSLSPEQQAKVISLLPNAPALAPDPTNPTASLPNIPQQMLAVNNAFRADIAMFQEDLSEGRLDPLWQRDGLVAMERRACGEFDAWKEKEMEAFWGQKQKLSYDVLAGESSKVKLETLVAAGCWEVGDVWLYSKVFGKTKNAVKIEKEATITSFTKDNRITFRFPKGQRKFSSATAGENIETGPLDGLTQLADKMIEADSRVTTWRHSNVWKEIRCFRKNQDIGSLWEIREIYWARQQENQN
ncbi:Asx homology domain-containing protein [Macrophomina phaseolina]|uniref:Asx homology domain-containing protein n=1 Tax=Macrophomina phaseolina TaxID=35725 RepID=A0ABQ8GKW5_9PEZI|nr:Asx homology domain-containing protein [Macrophomina phaseolina]